MCSGARLLEEEGSFHLQFYMQSQAPAFCGEMVRVQRTCACYNFIARMLPFIDCMTKLCGMCHCYVPPCILNDKVLSMQMTQLNVQLLLGFKLNDAVLRNIKYANLECCSFTQLFVVSIELCAYIFYISPFATAVTKLLNAIFPCHFILLSSMRYCKFLYLCIELLLKILSQVPAFGYLELYSS